MSKAKMKHAVKRGKGTTSYADRLTQQKRDWTKNVYYFTQQETLDAASLTLHELYGFGPERLKRFGEAFIKKFQEIQELNKSDKDDAEREWSRQRFEDAMKEAWGPYYAPREERYDLPYALNDSGRAVVDR